MPIIVCNFVILFMWPTIDSITFFVVGLYLLDVIRLPMPGAVPFHRILEACERSVPIRERFVGLLREAGERVAKTVAVGQGAGAVRDDVPAEALGVLLVTLALGFVASLEVGFPFDAESARGAVLALLAPAR